MCTVCSSMNRAEDGVCCNPSCNLNFNVSGVADSGSMLLKRRRVQLKPETVQPSAGGKPAKRPRTDKRRRPAQEEGEEDDCPRRADGRRMPQVYRCKLCGQPKRGHTCSAIVESRGRVAAAAALAPLAVLTDVTNHAGQGGLVLKFKAPFVYVRALAAGVLPVAVQPLAPGEEVIGAFLCGFEFGPTGAHGFAMLLFEIGLAGDAAHIIAKAAAVIGDKGLDQPRIFERPGFGIVIFNRHRRLPYGLQSEDGCEK